jgi:hypothetical protein
MGREHDTQPVKFRDQPLVFFLGPNHARLYAGEPPRFFHLPLSHSTRPGSFPEVIAGMRVSSLRPISG